MTPLILNLDTRWRWLVNFMPRTLNRCTRSTERSVGPKTGLDVSEKRSASGMLRALN